MEKLKKVIVLILAMLVIQSCNWERKPDKYPLTVVSIYKDENLPGYTHYTIRDSDPRKDGLGSNAMHIYLIDKDGKFQIGDTIIFNKK